MNPATLVATALTLGAARFKAGSDAAVEVYIRLKELIRRRYPQVQLAELEETPSSEAQRDAVENELVRAGADHDEEVLHLARELNARARALERMQEHGRRVVIHPSEGGLAAVHPDRIDRCYPERRDVGDKRGDVVLANVGSSADVLHLGYLAYDPPSLLRVGALAEDGARAVKQQLLAWPGDGSAQATSAQQE